MAGVSDIEVVVSGVTGHFPKSDNVEEFAENLFKGIPLQSNNLPWQTDDPPLPKSQGFIENADTFDADFFGVLPIQAQSSSPERRKLLEAAYEAIFDAGLSPKDLKNTNCGVYIGVNGVESDARLLSCPKAAFDKIPGMLDTTAVLCSSVSFWLDLKGPSLNINTGCSSSLNALHLAYQDIKSGRCDSALVGAAKLSRLPYFTQAMMEEGFLAPDGYCKTFDASGDGFGRSECISMVLLQKACDAKRIYCTIVGTRSGQEGYKESGLSQTYGTAHAELIKELYTSCGVDMQDICYVELHGTGTKVGDSEEAKGLDLCLDAARKEPLLVGSAKSNVGHTESAAGLVGLTKVIIAMESGKIPPNIHFHNPNTNIPALMEGRLKVVAESTELPDGLVGINCFGVGGSVVHCLLKKHSANKPPHNRGSMPWLVTCSGRTEQAVSSILNGVLTNEVDPELVKLIHDVHLNTIKNHTHRGFAVLDQKNNKKEEIVCSPTDKRPICFLFTGLGSQWVGMGRYLMDLPMFRETVDQCAAILSPLGIDIHKILCNEESGLFDYIVNAFVGVIVFQIALLNVLKQLSIVPDVILGQSAGELTCAYADGCLTLEETVLAAYYRGLASVNSVNPPGAMAIIGRGGKDLGEILPEEIEIACYYSSSYCILSGPKKVITSFCAALAKNNISANLVHWTNGLAYHSSLVKNAGLKYLEFLKHVIKTPKKRSSKWISSVGDGDLCDESSPMYHYRNFTGAVFLETAYQKVPLNAVVIELGPNGILTPMLEKIATIDCFSLCDKKTENSLFHFLASVGRLYNYGTNPNLSALYPTVSYPVSRGTKMLSPLVKWNHSRTWDMPIYEDLAKSGHHVVFLDPEDFEYVVDEKKIFPFSSCLFEVWKAFAAMVSRKVSEMVATFADVLCHAPVILKERSRLIINISPYTGHFDVMSRSALHMSGTISLSERFSDNLPESDQNNDETNIDRDDFYYELHKRGLQPSSTHRGVLSVNASLTRAQVKNDKSLDGLIDSFIQLTMLLNFTRKVQEIEKIERIKIDTSQLAKNPNSLTVLINKASRTLSGNGIEMKSVTFMEVTPSANPDPFVEKNIFVPFFKTEGASFAEAFQLCLHLVAQNNPETKNNILRLKTKDSSEEIYELITASEKSTLTSSFELTTIGSQAQLCQRKQEFQLMMSDVIDEHFKACFMKCLKNNGFLLLETTPAAEIEIPGFVVCVDHSWNGQKLVLLRKTQPKKTYQLIDLDEPVENWLWKTQKITEEETNFLVVSTHHCSGIIGLVLSLKCELGQDKIRSIFLRGTDNFPIDLSEFDNQLKGDMLVNVRQDGQWGTFKHFDVSERIENLPGIVFNEDDCFIVTGGLGGVGRELITWMISHGARKFAIATRSGISSPYQQYITDCWKDKNVKITVTSSDISTLEGARTVLEKALESGPVAGIFHLAVRNDFQSLAVFERNDLIRFKAAENFDQLSRELCPHLKYFMMFSTVGAGRGSSCQLPYNYSSSRMDRLSEIRTRAGLPSLSVQYGMIDKTGSASSVSVEELVGLKNQHVRSCLEVMEKLLQTPYPVASSVVLDPRNTSKEVQKTAPEVAAAIMGIQNWQTVPPKASFASLGIDSLTSMRIQDALLRYFNIAVPIADIRKLSFSSLLELAE